jgi:hypothetical protein
MDIEALSTNSLHLLHDRIWLSLMEDDSLPEGEKRYGMREYRDHRQQADQIEAEFKRREETFAPLPW